MYLLKLFKHDDDFRFKKKIHQDTTIFPKLGGRYASETGLESIHCFSTYSSLSSWPARSSPHYQDNQAGPIFVLVDCCITTLSIVDV